MNVLSQIEVEQIEHEFLDKWRARRADKKEQKAAQKLELVNARADNRRNGGGIFSGLGSTISGILGGAGGGANSTQQMPVQNRGLEVQFGPEKPDNSKMIIAIVGVLLVVAVVFMVLKAKKSK